MIAAKIRSVVKRLDKLELLVSRDVWEILRAAMAELTDAAASAEALENHQTDQAPSLTVADIFTAHDDQGNLLVNLDGLAGLMGDLSEALYDVAEAMQVKSRVVGSAPQLALISSPQLTITSKTEEI